MAKKLTGHKKQLIVMLSEKGGDGKTTFAKALTDFKRRGFVYDAKGAPMLDSAGDPLTSKRQVLVVDCNPKVGQLADSYGIKDASGNYDLKANMENPLEGVLTVDIKDKKKCEDLMDYIDFGADDIILDMPGGSVNDVSAVFGSVDKFIDAYQEEHYDVVVIMVISHLLPSAKNIGPIMTAWNKANRFIVVKNAGRAPADMFIYFDGEDKATAGSPDELLSKAGGQVIVMPKMDDDTYARFDGKQISFSAAADKDNSPFRRTDRIRVREFMGDCDKQILQLNLA